MPRFMPATVAVLAILVASPTAAALGSSSSASVSSLGSSSVSGSSLGSSSVSGSSLTPPPSLRRELGSSLGSASVSGSSLGSISSSSGTSRTLTRRDLAVAPDGYGQVGQTLFGVIDSVGTTTGTSDVEFGYNVAISDDGLRMAVGSRNHDWLSADGSGTVNSNGGAIFIYDYDGTEWVYKDHIVGAVDEELGRWPISLSSDGLTLAMRRGGNQPRRAEVYSVDVATGALTKLGGDIDCDDGGNGMVALTETSEEVIRLASGCPNDGNGTSGKVRVLDYNTTTSAWEQVGDVLALDDDGTSTAGFYGFDLAWALDGTRLAISAPDAEDTLSKQGLVRVLKFDAGTWTPLGQDIKGNQAIEKLGFSMALSGDGETLVIGSPNKDVDVNNNAENTGSTFVYTLNTTADPETWDLQEEIVGAAGSGFGRGIHVSSDGSLFCSASVSSYNGDRGQLRVFDLSSGSPATELAEFEGLVGDKLFSAAMTSSGSRLVLGSVGSQVNGIVQVFDDGFTPAPSLSPSLAPSASSAPTIETPANDNLTPFDWDLEPQPDLTSFTFSEDADTSEIQLFYNISLRNTTIQAFESDCTTPIPDNVTSLDSRITNTSLTHGSFVIDVNIQQDTVTESPIWSDQGVGVGLISMCIRLDLTLGDPADTSVNFHETVMDVTVGLLQGFEITNIDLDRVNATEVTDSVDFEYNVTACHCDGIYGDCVNDVLTQGSDVYLCVETTAPNVEIASIRDLTMAQNSFNTTPIENGIEDPLTETSIDGKEATIRYQIISQFFEDPNPDDIVATGSVLLAFTDDNGTRFLRHAKVLPAAARELNDVEGFNVRMSVESANPETSGAACGLFGGMIVLVVSGASLMVF
jgi:hypothetical protein